MTVAIAGAAESDLGVTGLSILGLQTQAVTRALADAGLSLSDVDGIATTGVSRFSATQLADHLGLTPAWTDSTFATSSAAGADSVSRPKPNRAPCRISDEVRPAFIAAY